MSTNLKILIKKIKLKKKYLKLSSKIYKDLGWKCKLGLKKSLDLTIKLYLTKRDKLFDKTKEQILVFLINHQRFFKIFHKVILNFPTRIIREILNWF